MKGAQHLYGSDGRPRRFRFLLGFLSAAYCVCLVNPAGAAWSETKAQAQVVAPAQAECVMEAGSRRILYELNGERTLPMASTTKILTAITVLENCADIRAEFPIPPEATGVEGSSVYLKSGDIYSVEDLLYGLMLRSGNDCAEALALCIGGSMDSFALRMNETARKAGALHSHFKNPHGLPCEGHYTTARDLTLIACYAMHNPEFRKIVGTRYYEPRHWANKNKILKTYEGAVGIKTGYTKAAGRCLVTAAERDGMTLVCTVLNCPVMYERSAVLLDDAFQAYERVRILGADTLVPVAENLRGCTREELYYPLLPEEKMYLRIETEKAPEMFGRQKNDEIIGQVKIYLSNQLLFSRNLYKL